VQGHPKPALVRNSGGIIDRGGPAPLVVAVGSFLSGIAAAQEAARSRCRTTKYAYERIVVKKVREVFGK